MRPKIKYIECGYDCCERLYHAELTGRIKYTVFEEGTLIQFEIVYTKPRFFGMGTPKTIYKWATSIELEEYDEPTKVFIYDCHGASGHATN